ncbi:MAG: elongation factor G [Vulcanimicrobiota bacterium]
MKVYKTDKIRNIGFFGHVGTGKTTTVEAMLFDTKATDRFGKVTEGNTVSDFDPDEIKKGMSIFTTVIPVEYKQHKLNILDTPGFLDFEAQFLSALKVVEAGVFFVSANSGVEVGLEREWKVSLDKKMGKIFFINKLDKENSDFEKTMESIKDTLKLEGTMVPLQVPIGKEENFKGIVDLVEMCSYIFDNGKAVKGEIPADMQDKIDELREQMVEASAGTDEKMIEKFFEGELTDEDIKNGLLKGIKSGKVYPILCGAAEKNIGITTLMDSLIHFCPTPDEMGEIKATKPGSDDEISLKPDADQPFSGFVFKTTTDPYVGRLSVVRIYSGTLKPDTVVFNPNKSKDEKISNVMIFRGKDHETIDTAYAGDIITLAKLSETVTNDTLCARENPVVFPPIEFPDPLMSMALYPKSKGDEDKLSVGLAKIMEEDPTFNVFRDPVTKETVISGIGDVQLNILMDRMKRKFNVEVILTTPKVPYKETIKGKTQVEHKYKKQSGGRGQYGHVCLELEPMPRGEGYEFVDKIVGGVIPRNYIPAVDKGLRKVMEEGVIAGYPFVDVRATLYFGSYHTVDSSDMAFQIAASQAFKKGIPNAKPILLEPIYELEITVPDEFTGDVIGDINSRRGRILGMDPLGDGLQFIRATAPLAEVMKYSIDLRSLTQGKGTYSQKFLTYEEVPAQAMEQIVAEAKKEEEE